MSMLDIKGIETSYGETQVLFDVSLNIAPGEVVSLLGPNGAGKTTTLRSILGLTPPTRGSTGMPPPELAAVRTARPLAPSSNTFSEVPGGGQVVAAGTPETIAACEAGHTGRHLRAVLSGGTHER